MPACHSPFHFTLALLALAGWLPPRLAQAHGDLDGRLTQSSALIAAQPDDANLRLKRADLRRQHQEFDAALADLDVAERLGAERRMILLARTRVFSDAGRTTNALQTADELLAVEGNSPEGFVLRARCRFKLNQIKGAVEDYDAALARIASPEPDLFLERARAQAALGQLANAVKGLDEGMVRLGEIAALQLAAIEYSRQGADFDAALARVEKLTAQAPVKEPWLVLRGEVLAQAGRLTEAKAAFQRALSGMESYPTAKRGLEQTIQLQARAREGLVRVEARLAKKVKSVNPSS